MIVTAKLDEVLADVCMKKVYQCITHLSFCVIRQYMLAGNLCSNYKEI